MAEVKWIKMSTDIFDNRKIRQIECLPDGDAIIVIWLKLLCLAGSINDDGYIYFTSEIPYTEQMLATQFNRPISTIQMALNTFERFGMIDVIDSIFKVSNWEKYQNVEGMDRIREQTKIRVAKHRENKRIEQCNVTRNVTVTQCNATDIDKDIEKKEEKEENKSVMENAFDFVFPNGDHDGVKQALIKYSIHQDQRGISFTEVQVQTIIQRAVSMLQTSDDQSVIDAINTAISGGYQNFYLSNTKEKANDKKQKEDDFWKAFNERNKDKFK